MNKKILSILLIGLIAIVGVGCNKKSDAATPTDLESTTEISKEQTDTTNTNTVNENIDENKEITAAPAEANAGAINPAAAQQQPAPAKATSAPAKAKATNAPAKAKATNAPAKKTTAKKSSSSGSSSGGALNGLTPGQTWNVTKTGEGEIDPGGNTWEGGKVVGW